MMRLTNLPIKIVKNMKKRYKRSIAFALMLFIAICCFRNSDITTANSLRQKQMVVSKNSNYVADSFNGVKSVYRRGGNDGSSKTYSCAAFVKKYYKKVYKVTIFNLFYNRTPSVTGGSIKKVSSPQIGDIVAMNTNHATTHWAIVKAVNSNNTVTLIEQNWKWQLGGRTYTVVNRKVKFSSARFYRLKNAKTSTEKTNSFFSVKPNTTKTSNTED